MRIILVLLLGFCVVSCQAWWGWSDGTNGNVTSAESTAKSPTPTSSRSHHHHTSHSHHHKSASPAPTSSHSHHHHTSHSHHHKPSSSSTSHHHGHNSKPSPQTHHSEKTSSHKHHMHHHRHASGNKPILNAETHEASGKKSEENSARLFVIEAKEKPENNIFKLAKESGEDSSEELEEKSGEQIAEISEENSGESSSEESSEESSESSLEKSGESSSEESKEESGEESSEESKSESEEDSSEESDEDSNEDTPFQRHHFRGTEPYYHHYHAPSHHPHHRHHKHDFSEKLYHDDYKSYHHHSPWHRSGYSYTHKHSSAKKLSHCPMLYKNIGDRCIAIFSIAKVSWWDAADFCESIFGELISFTDFLQYFEFINHLQISDATSDFWIGGKTEGKTWKWIDRNPMPLGSPYWAIKSNSVPNWSREAEKYYQAPSPTASFGLGMYSPRCASMSSKYFYYMSDEDCESQRSPVCVLKDDAEVVVLKEWAKGSEIPIEIGVQHPVITPGTPRPGTSEMGSGESNESFEHSDSDESSEGSGGWIWYDGSWYDRE